MVEKSSAVHWAMLTKIAARRLFRNLAARIGVKLKNAFRIISLGSCKESFARIEQFRRNQKSKESADRKSVV